MPSVGIELETLFQLLFSAQPHGAAPPLSKKLGFVFFFRKFFAENFFMWGLTFIKKH